MNKLAVSFMYYQVGVLEYTQMLRSDGLFKLKGCVDFIHIHLFGFVYETQDFKPEGVRYRPEDSTCFL